MEALLLLLNINNLTTMEALYNYSASIVVRLLMFSNNNSASIVVRLLMFSSNNSASIVVRLLMFSNNNSASIVVVTEH
jgi:hypothetical protein